MSRPSPKRVAARWKVGAGSYRIQPLRKLDEGEFRVALTALARDKFGPALFDKTYGTDAPEGLLDLGEGGSIAPGHEFLVWLGLGIKPNEFMDISEREAVRVAKATQAKTGVALGVYTPHYSGMASRGHYSQDELRIWPNREKVPRQKGEYPIVGGEATVAVGAKHVYVMGNTFPLKGKLRNFGFWWDKSIGVWRMSKRDYSEWLAEKLRAL